MLPGCVFDVVGSCCLCSHEREGTRQEVKKTESEFVANGDKEKREERKGQPNGSTVSGIRPGNGLREGYASDEGTGGPRGGLADLEYSPLYYA